ncbi:hypothetical protein LWI28_010868 [Acer negundo]|uniref:Uncharacterized protein n=1 Tax=Acer negundo TaxID=4023 RepID=A0AAD5IQE4_ACENE|nr:hypothetical protein LWI28_010868 [Acer negundo]
MQIGQLPFSYLGVPLFRGKPRKVVLRPIADNILRGISGIHRSLMEGMSPPQFGLLFGQIIVPFLKKVSSRLARTLNGTFGGIIVSEANRLDIGCMRNCMDDFLILSRSGLLGRLSKAPVIKSVIWSPPAPGWNKVNTDGAVMGSLGFGGCGGIFRNCKAFVKSCFAIPLGQVFAFEA